MYLYNSIYLLVWVIHMHKISCLLKSNFQVYILHIKLFMYSTLFEEFSFIVIILNKMCFYQQNNKPKVRSGKK